MSKLAWLAGLVTLALWMTGCSDDILRSAIRSGGLAAPAALQAPAAPNDGPAVYTRTLYAETVVILPTYPVERYQTAAVDPIFRWPYKRFDRDRFLLEAPPPQLRAYRVVILENEYLRALILPELGGRLWQVIHKPSGDAMFYQNAVVKPSPWGPGQQLGWFGLGGLEWNLPVIEHGYDWGTVWEVQPLQKDDGSAAVVVSTPRDGRLLHAAVEISLHPGVASVEIAPRVTNLSEQTVVFDYWQTAMLAPGAGNRPSADLHFVLPGTHMAVHSTGNRTLPGPQQRFTWPTYQGVDMSRLGNWNEYLGFFEYPAAHGPFVGVYDRVYDAGAAHIYPAEVVRGSKVFALGWSNPLGSEHFTDDGSAYVELHSGLAPSFFEHTQLAGGGAIAWREWWYPIHGIGDLAWASQETALAVQLSAEGVRTGVYTTRPVQGELLLLLDGKVAARQPFAAAPDAPYTGLLAWRPAATGKIELQVIGAEGETLATFIVREK
jgi:hypothetical protein